MNKNQQMAERRVGMEFTNKRGLKYKVLEYNGYHDVVVEFENGLVKKSKCWGNVISGNMNCSNTKIIKHDMIGKYKTGYHSLYQLWYRMVKKCEDKNNKLYPYFGGNGYTIAEEWKKCNNFLNDIEKIKGFDIFEQGERVCILVNNQKKIFNLENCVITTFPFGCLFRPDSKGFYYNQWMQTWTVALSYQGRKYHKCGFDSEESAKTGFILLFNENVFKPYIAEHEVPEWFCYENLMVK